MSGYNLPTMLTWADNDLVTPAEMNSQVRDAGLLAVSPPAAKVSKATSYAQANSLAMSPTFDTVVFNTDNMVDFTAVPSGLVIQTPGIYLVTAAYDMQSDTSAVVRGSVTVLVNGGNEFCRMQKTIDWSPHAEIGIITGYTRLVAADHLTWQAVVVGTGNTTFGANIRTSLAAMWVGE